MSSPTLSALVSIVFLPDLLSVTAVVRGPDRALLSGGIPLGDGQWIVVGGNQAVTTGGNATAPGGPDPYKDTDGGLSIRLVRILTLAPPKS